MVIRLVIVILVILPERRVREAKKLHLQQHCGHWLVLVGNSVEFISLTSCEGK